MVSSPTTVMGGSGDAGAGRDGGRLLIAAWWLCVACTGVLIARFGEQYLPAKFSLDAQIVYDYMAAPDLWTGLSFDSYLNTARLWSLVLALLPKSVAIPAYYCAVVALTVRLLNVFEVHSARYQLLAGAWVACSALFMTFPNKETIALPIALWLCVAGSRASRLMATLVFLAYAAFFRQYWAICFFYFACAWMALRLHVAHRGRAAVGVMLVACVAPFVLAGALGFEPLTDARMSMNADRVDSPDARSAFNNTFENTGIVTDLANAAIAWPYMNVPVALLAKSSPRYVFFAAFQLCSLWFFAAACAAFLRDARRIGRPGSVYLRCCAFVIAYSFTQAIFEPDFGSFLRHEVILMIPMLVVVFYRAHARRSLMPKLMDVRYGRNLSAHV